MHCSSDTRHSEIYTYLKYCEYNKNKILIFLNGKFIIQMIFHLQLCIRIIQLQTATLYHQIKTEQYFNKL